MDAAVTAVSVMEGSLVFLFHAGTFFTIQSIVRRHTFVQRGKRCCFQRRREGKGRQSK
jgi:hypothetical protein